MQHERHGAKQPDRFDPARAAVLDDPARFSYLQPERVLEELAPPAGGTIVDFGSGTGLYAIAIAQRQPDLRVVALDEQELMLQHVRAAIKKSGAHNVEAANPDTAHALAGLADRVLALNVLHELGDAALQDLRALLRPDGWAVLADWNAAVERPVGPPRDHVYTPDEAIARLSAASFTVEQRAPLPYHYVLVARPAR